jgi:orotidine-5'-phosphate decarboxylase
MAVSKPAPVAVALDAPDLETAARWAALVTPHVSTVKVGLELYLRYGPEVVATVRGASRVSVFLDLKLHDIPVTVAGAARAVARLRPEVLTVHAAGGADVVRAVVEAAPGTMVAAVTVLTSLGDDDLGRIGLSGPVPDAVLRLAALSVEAGAQGLVCSPREVSAVRAEVGDDVTLITPGGRQRGRRPGAGGHTGGGAAGRRGPAGDRPPHHPRIRSRRCRRGHRRVAAAGGHHAVVFTS